ncbi:histidine phosphatase superfamily [Phlebopus sp. FC_14]|nr:histidine phosphatase superfamily [Phlebopus sp. FC_14]
MVLLRPLVVLLSLSLSLVCAADPASNYAGSTVAASYPPAGVTNTAINAYFPGASQVGYPGPTPTGAEPDAIETAPTYPKVTNAYPLSRPNTADDVGDHFDVMKNWGNLSPMFSIEDLGVPDASPMIPVGCGLNQVFLLIRHGARYPTSGSGPAQFAAQIHAAATSSGFNVSGPLEFLATWTYKLGAEILTPFGRKALFDSGVAFRMRYGHLLDAFSDLPVWRTTSEDRMVDSALNFAAGFFDVRTYESDYHQEIIIEASGFNNTLAPYETCNNANTDSIGYYGSTQANKWSQIYLQSALSRLQPMITGYNLTIDDLSNMQMMCAYEVVALGFSEFCALFTAEEWEGFEYAIDLEFWYNDGPGNPTAAAQGLGYVQELVSRLTQTRITTWNSTTNSTLDSNDITFPLDQPIFVDATHDVVISNILTALNFTSLAATGPLPVDYIPPERSYVASKIAPFASNLVAQVLSCPASGESTHIRFILNDAVLPMTGINGCEDDSNGLCSLPSFVSAMHRRIAEIDFAFDCFANYTMPDPDHITDGRYPDWLKNAA